MKKKSHKRTSTSKKICLLLLIFCSIVSTMNAQDYIKPVDGKGFFTKVTMQSEDFIIYESQRTQFKVPRKDIVLVEYQEMGLIFYNKEHIQKLDLTNYEGLLFSKGNRIYIPFSSTKVAQRVGSMKLRELLSKDGYWEIVDCEEEAHCIMEYVFSESGRDHAYFIIKDRSGNVLYISPRVSASDWIPSHAGTKSANSLYKSHISKLKKEIDNNKIKMDNRKIKISKKKITDYEDFY